ncbi:MAG: YceH family protein [Proteobacteria bacterium]|nr:YceH family protein [Pseudomonadota bacterium]MBU1715453.1 YceH family protein [Pseudomonadota bacterium]
MDIELNDAEARVLGCLIEKSMTTPEYYPLSLTALTTACNQKSNRNPVVSFDQKTVVRGIESLKEKQLAVQGDSSRVPKYAEIFVDRNNVVAREAALLMILFLRGPQTLGELRGRTERAYKFADLGEVESTIDDLIDAGYVTQLPRLAGRKEHRYAHLFCGEPQIEAETSRPEPATIEVRAENERIAGLENDVNQLKSEFSTLRDEFDQFRKEFE